MLAGFSNPPLDALSDVKRGMVSLRPSASREKEAPGILKLILKVRFLNRAQQARAKTIRKNTYGTRDRSEIGRIRATS
jgi:hypothetical protein